MEETTRLSKSQERIAEIVDATKDLLLYKNKMYGDVALNPVGIFTKSIFKWKNRPNKIPSSNGFNKWKKKKKKKALIGI